MQPKVNGVWMSRTRNVVKINGVWRPVLKGWIKVKGDWRLHYNPPSYAIFDGTFTPQSFNWNGNQGRGYGPFGPPPSNEVGNINPKTMPGVKTNAYISHLGVFESSRGDGPPRRILEISVGKSGDLKDQAALICNYNGYIGWLRKTFYAAETDNAYIWYEFGDDIYFTSDSPVKLSF